MYIQRILGHTFCLISNLNLPYEHIVTNVLRILCKHSHTYFVNKYMGRYHEAV